MGARLFDRQIDQAIIAFVQKHVWPCIDKELSSEDRKLLLPSNSQLARLRVLVRRAQLNKDTAMVARDFARFRPFARQGYERAQLAAMRDNLATWINNLLNNPSQVWRELGDPAAPEVAGLMAERTDTHAREVTLRLLSAVLVAPAQRRKAAALRAMEVRQ
jgi:hypothetical protein